MGLGWVAQGSTAFVGIFWAFPTIVYGLGTRPNHRQNLSSDNFELSPDFPSTDKSEIMSMIFSWDDMSLNKNVFSDHLIR